MNTMHAAVPEIRLRAANERPVRPDGRFVLYWMIAARRRRASFALQHAVRLAAELGRPLLVLEPLRCGYRWASDRLHTFVLQGMADNAAGFADAGVTYVPYVEPAPGAGKGLLAALAADACVVVTDDFPCFFVPRMVAAAARVVPVSLIAVDGNGLLPLRAADRVFARAFDFRRFLQKVLRTHLPERPVADPLRAYSGGRARVPAAVARRWRAASALLLAASPAALAKLPIDHTVAAGEARGGARAAAAVLRRFVQRRLPHYATGRGDPDADCASGLSPYLHFGHVSAHDVFAALARKERWSPDRVVATADGRRGWYGMSEGAESFLDQLVTWRELGFNFAWQRDEHASWRSLPAWAQRTLAAHAGDPREHVYSVGELAAARTHDAVWNAAQRQLRATGALHNQLRMLWGKKVLEWSARPQDALAALVELNDRFALDGRDPNSYCGIAWVFGRYDRAWGPERSVYGTVRYMSSGNTVRKVRMKQYLAKWGAT